MDEIRDWIVSCVQILTSHTSEEKTAGRIRRMKKDDAT